MNRDTLIAALVGGLIATIPVILSNVVQLIIHNSERNQKEKEAKIQSKEKLIERDIVQIMDSLEKLIALSSQQRSMDVRLQVIIKAKEGGVINEQEYTSDAKSLYDNFWTRFPEVNQYSDVISRLVYSFKDDKLVSAHGNFVKVMGMYLNSRIDNKAENDSIEANIDGIGWGIVTRQAGMFHSALRDKLISLRE